MLDRTLMGRSLLDIIAEKPFPIGNTLIRKTVALEDAAGGGAVGTIDLFTVTGTVLIKLVCVCTENLAGATATLEVGITGATAAIIAQTTATDIDANEIWHDATPDASIEADSVAAGYIITNGADIFATVATAAITDGTLEFYLAYVPLSADGVVVAA